MSNSTIRESSLPPDDAFAVLGNETRMDILRQLGTSDGPVPFSALREQVGVSDSGQFNYHLDKLVGHFLEKTEEGYQLRRAGERIVEAILSGAVSDAPVMSSTEIDQSCYHCGGPVTVNYAEEKVGVYCTECDGNYGGFDDLDESRIEELGGSLDPADRGRLGYVMLPPAGLRNRSPAEVLSAATIWGHLDLFAQGNGICPRCSARLDESVEVCRDHDGSTGLCPECNNRYAVQHAVDCTNCIFEQEALFMIALFGTTELLAFMTARGYNPISPTPELSFWEITGDYEEELISTDPFEARFTFFIDDDGLTLTVDDELSVVDATEHPSTEPVR